MKKRTAALAFLALLLALAAATLLVLRTEWAANRICALAAARVEAATRLPLAFRTCRVEPIALELEVEGVRLGPAEAPLFEAESVAARLVPVQAFGGRVQLAYVRAVRPRVALRIDGGSSHGGACPPPFLSRVEVQRLDVVEGAVELALPRGMRLSVARFDVHTRPAPRSLRALATPLRRARVDVGVEGVRLEGLGDKPFGVSRAAAETDLALDLSALDLGALDAVVDGVHIGASGRISNLCAPDLDLTASARGPFREVLALTRIATGADASGMVSADARIVGPARAPKVSGAVRLEKGRVAWFTPGDVRGEVHLLPGASGLAIDRFDWSYPGGKLTGRGSVGFSMPVALDAEVDLDGVELAEVFERVNIPGSWVTVKLDGKGRLGGTLVPPSVAGTFAGDFRDLEVRTHSYSLQPGERGLLEVRRGRLQTGFRVSHQALSFDAARISAGRGTSEVDAVANFDGAAGFSVRWRGQVDLDAMGRVGDIPWAGLMEVDGTAAAAPYGNPRLVARGTRVEGFRFLELDLGNVAADLLYGPDFVLRIQDAQGVKGQSHYHGEGMVDFGSKMPQVLSSSFEAKGRLRDLLDAVRDFVPSTRWVRESMDADVEMSGTAHGPAGALDGTYDMRLGVGTLRGRPFDSGRAVGTVVHGEEARVERAELRRGTGVARMQGRWGFKPPIPWDLDVSFAGVPLDALALPGGGWSGSASGTAALAGSYEHPRVRFAANGDGVSVRGVSLGTVQLGGTIQERRLLMTATSGALRLEGEAALEGRLPFTAKAELALDDVSRLVPGGAPAGLKARVHGEAQAEGELEDLAGARARIRLDALEVGHSELRVAAAGPVVLTLVRGRLEVQDLVLRGPNTELTVSGSRGADGELDLAATGTVDLRLLGGLTPELRRPHGLLTLEAHVSGTVPEPVLVGAGRLDDAGFQLKGTQALFSELRGDLAFSQNRVLFEQLSAAVNGGRAELKGEVELASFVPVRLRVEAKLDEVPVAVPAWLPATLSGRVEAAGAPDATLVTGRLHVIRSRYTANVDLEKSLLDVRRKPPLQVRAYDKAGEWLRFDVQIAVDGDVRVENDLVNGDVRGELALTGSLAAPGLVGALAMAEGSRARFRGNEFALTHAVLDFTDRNKIEILMDVHGQSQVRDYQIFMHAFGPLAAPQLTLTSAPALTQPDILTLLSLGFTRRDAAASAGTSGVATAAAAQALFSASGLDEQVKRFLPRGGVLRDYTVRITSEWSEQVGQVEPRAEFESWLLRDRLRLRFQAPLSGGRGQKAQAELRLGSHTSLQYQWDNETPDVGTGGENGWLGAGDHGVDLKLRWEWTDE